MFQPASNTTAYLKAGITGEPGAGKSITAGLFAIGLVQHLRKLGIPGADKPVGFFDTEKGSDWLIPLFEETGIPLVVAKERTFAKAVEAMKYMKAHCSVGIFDSVTHPWDELKQSWMTKKERSYLQIDEIVQIKRQWQQQFSDEFMNSPFHAIICGRAGDETEQWVDEQGKRQFEKVGIKMQAEKNTAYEPSLSILMERDQHLRTKQTAHFATVTKDRSTLLDGKQFTFASYSDKGERLPTQVLVNQVWVSFKPHIERLNLGGRHVAVQASGDSTHILKTERRDWQPVQRKIVLGEIADLLTLHVPGQAVAEKKRRIELLKACFGCGWVEIEEAMALCDLRAGFDLLHQELEGKPSKYAGKIEAETVEIELNDDLPDHSKAPAASSLASAAA